MPRGIDRDGKIFTGELVAKALRDSGYKNTAYALAELIDNSIQAKAKNIEVFCSEEVTTVRERNRKRLSAIAVLDDGVGMDAEVLRASLMFGNGTRLDDRSGIGRFGMGLPNASFSQARRVEIFSWQDGPTNAQWTYIDVDEIESGKQEHVPAPKHKALPNLWASKANHKLSDSGTLVVWTKLDSERLTWKQARPTLQHTNDLIGRIYRRFIAKGKLVIRLVEVTEGSVTYSTDAVVNDPMYLMAPSTTPFPFHDKPMFLSWGEDEIFEVEHRKKKHKISVRFSYASPATLSSDVPDRGGTPFGKHAGKNIGVSLVRSDRELELDPNWAIGYDPRERWWGCEVDFPAALDEIFGVTINKQAATLWAQFAQLEWTVLAEAGETTRPQVIERLRDEEDPRGVLLDIAEFIRKQLAQIRDRIKDQTKGRRSGEKRHEGPTVEDVATSKIKDRAKDHPTEQDEETFGEKEAGDLKKDLVEEKKYGEEAADEIVTSVWERNLRLIFIEADLDGAAFFKVDEKAGGVSEVVINRKHPFYRRLYEALLPEAAMEDQMSTEERLERARDALRLMFAAWARFEQESSERERRQLDDVRQDWGRMARFFLEDEQ